MQFKKQLPNWRGIAGQTRRIHSLFRILHKAEPIDSRSSFSTQSGDILQAVSANQRVKICLCHMLHFRKGKSETVGHAAQKKSISENAERLTLTCSDRQKLSACCLIKM
uniref:Uncharacterized protein n=1 Tax=Anguilla anguilla TaxID=7936 RepID=A0A0E9XH68_ANGAN